MHSLFPIALCLFEIYILYVPATVEILGDSH
jgi:hypothetical protein